MSPSTCTTSMPGNDLSRGTLRAGGARTARERTATTAVAISSRSPSERSTRTTTGLVGRGLASTLP